MCSGADFIFQMSFMQLARLKKLLVKQPDKGVRKTVTGATPSSNDTGNMVQPIVENRLDGPWKEKNVAESQQWRLLKDLVEDNVEHALGKQSSSQYGYWWGRFGKFCRQYNRSQEPFNAVTAAAFLTWLAEQSEGLGGVDQARSALRHFHYRKFPDVISPTEGVRVSMVVKGIKRKFKQPVKKKKALNPAEFEKLLMVLVNGLEFEEMKLVDLRLAAQLSLLFCTFSRYEESAALKISHIVEEEDDLVVLFPKGKQYQFGEARESVILSQPQLKINPVVVLKSYIRRLRDFSNVQWLFPSLKCKGKKVVIAETPASYESVLRQFKKAAKHAKIVGTPRDYGLHSFRRGGVTTAVNNGCDEHTVQKQMRVASTKTVARYDTLSRCRLKRANKALFM